MAKTRLSFKKVKADWEAFMNDEYCTYEFIRVRGGFALRCVVYYKMQYAGPVASGPEWKTLKEAAAALEEAKEEQKQLTELDKRFEEEEAKIDWDEIRRHEIEQHEQWIKEGKEFDKRFDEEMSKFCG